LRGTHAIRFRSNAHGTRLLELRLGRKFGKFELPLSLHVRHAILVANQQRIEGDDAE
jgi:hypothetical protein